MGILPRSALHIWRVNWSRRRIIRDLITREFKLRYMGSFLGSYWNLINPIVMITIYTVIFSRFMKARLIGVQSDAFAYMLYLVSAQLAWTAFTEMLSRGTRGFLENAGLIKKLAFPMEIIQTVIFGSATITFAFSMAIYLLVATIVGHPPTWYALLIPVVYILQSIFSIGLAHVFATWNVFFRDTEQALTHILTVWFWLTPIVYFEEIIPEKFQIFLWLNPMHYYVRMYHDLLIKQQMPAPEIWLGAGLCAAVFYFVGASFMCRLKADIPDLI